MLRFVGVDGCSGGWLSVMLDLNGRWFVSVERNIVELWSRWSFVDLVLIDIPIGLTESGPAERTCDKSARSVLGGRSSSVFPAPCRPALTARSYQEASLVNYEQTGRRLSKQSWAIAPKIKQVDDLLRSDELARRVVREVHPELLFWAFNDGCPMTHSKRTPEGASERLAILERLFSSTHDVVDFAERVINKSLFDRDDVVDALAAAVAGWMSGGSLKRLPVDLEEDSAGLPMQMVYARL